MQNITDQNLIRCLESLPADYWDFKDSDTKEYTHGLHAYPAMMVYPISRNIIRIVKSVMPVESLLDPFSGSGTVLVEGMLAGIKKVSGNDMNPLAFFLCGVKTKRLDIARLKAECSRLIEAIQKNYAADSLFFESADAYMRDVLSLDLTSRDGWGVNASQFLRMYCEHSAVCFEIPDFKNMGYWFKPNVILALQLIKRNIQTIGDPEIRNFIFVAYSEAIRLVSNRRNGEFKMFRMPPEKVEVFTPNVIDEFAKVLTRNIEKMRNFCEACPSEQCRTSIRIFQNNTVNLNDVEDNAYDLIITSPPYGDSRTTVAYGEYSRLSLQWLGLYNLSEKEIMGIDRSLMGGRKYRDGFTYSLNSKILSQSLNRIGNTDTERAGDVYSYYDDLDKSIASISKKTRIGGYHFWVVGNRTVKNELLQTDRIITELAEVHGMKHVYTMNRNISNKSMPSMNSPTNEVGKTVATMTNEHIVVLRKDT